jgi:hypothetical protein
MRSSFSNVFWLAALLLPLQACAQLTYSAKEIHGKIVDADTGQPLEGVNIIAQWKIDRAWVGDEKALLHVTEAVTDKDGNYSFPAWGPITLPPLADFGEGRDPLISIFKSGYDVEFLDNGIVSDIRYRRTPLGEFKWNGATTKLKKWKGNVRDYWWRVGVMSGGLPDSNKAWRKYPRMALVLIKEQKRLKELGAPMGLPGVPSQGLTSEDETFLKRFEQ